MEKQKWLTKGAGGILVGDREVKTLKALKYLGVLSSLTKTTSGWKMLIVWKQWPKTLLKIWRVRGPSVNKRKLLMVIAVSIILYTIPMWKEF